MTVENRISLKIDETKREGINNKITGLKKELSPMLVALSPNQKRDLPKIGEHLMNFVEEAVYAAEQNLSVVPPYLNLEEVRVDMNAWKYLHSVSKELEQLLSLLNDTATLSGSEAYSSMLSFYNFIKQASKDGVPGAKPIYERLKHYFPGTGNKNNNKKSEE